MPVDAGRLSANAFGALDMAMLMPRPTRWALLDAGVRALPGLAFPAAEVQCLTRCTELSKLLYHRRHHQEATRSPHEDLLDVA
jgi:hypothetical protein